MKASNDFKQVIKDYLDNLAIQDTLFSKTYVKENKNIDDCITYILNQVKDSGCNGFADDEIFNMAIHYYDEDDIKTEKKISAKVIVNHSVQSTSKQTKETKNEEKAQEIKPKKIKASEKVINQTTLEL